MAENLKVLFICSAGMSSAMVVKSFTKEAEKAGYTVEAIAIPALEAEAELNKKYWELVMVAPQIRHRIDEMKQFAEKSNIPCAVITPQGYTPMGGTILLKQVLELLNK